MSSTALAGIKPVTSLANKANPVYEIDPLTDVRWPELVEEHPRASVFHTRPWLQSLKKTYGYVPVAYTTCEPGEPLTNACAFCRVESWITGRRLVSLPFSDYCDPLLDADAGLFDGLIKAIEAQVKAEKLRYAELRPTFPYEFDSSLPCTRIPYYFHTLDLSPTIEELFHNCHHDSTQRKIRRAEREQLTCREGRSNDLLECFYELFTATRQRHHIPPPPLRWFHNLLAEFGEAIKISVAYKDGHHVAAIITLRHKKTFTYKYGAVDAQSTRHGSMQFLLWRAIEEAKRAGFLYFDFGRTDFDQQGLVTFKDRWGTSRIQLEYRRYSRAPRKGAHVFEINGSPMWKTASQFVVSHLPPKILARVGASLYGHVG